MLTTERQLTTRVSELSIEENYTNLDIEEYEKDLTNVNKNNGYTFRYPQRWLESPSQNKAVGIRRLDIIPTTHVLSLKFSPLNPVNDDEDPDPEILNIEIMTSNTLFEILSAICNEFNTRFKKIDDAYRLNYKYSNGILEILCTYIDENGGIHDAGFTIEDPIFGLENVKEATNLIEFLKFLNQNTTTTDLLKLTIYSTTKTFDNVWDREYLEFHASFSDSKRRFIGIKGDFYEKPTVLYNAPTDGSTFNIKFTSDGKNSIYPKYCRFIIQLVFMYNYKKTIVL